MEIHNLFKFFLTKVQKQLSGEIKFFKKQRHCSNWISIGKKKKELQLKPHNLYRNELKMDHRIGCIAK